MNHSCSIRGNSCERSSLPLVDNVTAHVGNEGCWNLDAVLGLIVLQQGSNDARQGESRAVKRVAELGLLVVGTTVAALQTVGLIGVEVADRRDLEPATLSLRIDLKIVANRTGKTLIATA